MLVYELFNAQCDTDYRSLEYAVLEGKLSQDDYAIKCVRLEFIATKRTQAFLRVHPLKGTNFKNSPYYSSIREYKGDFNDYLRYLGSQDNQGFDALNYYREGYTRVLKSSARSPSPR
jgi:hypothetical protein